MRANEYVVFVECVEVGVLRSRRRADKHAEDPLTDAQWARVSAAVEDEVVNAVCEKFTFAPETNEE